MHNETNMSTLFTTQYLERKPVEQVVLKDEVAEALIGKIVRNKSWGKSNLVSLQLGDSYEWEGMNASNLEFQTNQSNRMDIEADITPRIMTSRFWITGPERERLETLPADQYKESLADIFERFDGRLKASVTRMLLGSENGMLAYAYNASSSATVTLYGLDGVQLAEEHIIWKHLKVGKGLDACITSTGAPVTSGSNNKIVSIAPASGTVTLTTAIDLSGGGGDLTYYMLRPYSKFGTSTAVQPAGILTMISNAASYLADTSGTAIANTTAGYEEWRTIQKAFTGSDLAGWIIDQLFECCNGTPDVILTDPGVLAKARENAATARYFINVPDTTLGFVKTIYTGPSKTGQVVSSGYCRGWGRIYLINTAMLGMVGTLTEPKWLRPQMKLDDDQYYYFNDMNFTVQAYTKKRNAHAIGTGLTKLY